MADTARHNHAAEDAPPPGDDKKRPSGTSGLLQKRPWLLTLGKVLIVLLVVAGIWWWWESRRYESTEDAQIDGDMYPVSARINGQVVRVRVNDGQRVKTGALLVEIDDRDLQVAAAKARSEYANAESAAAAAQLQVPVSQVGSTSQIRSADADVQAAEAGVVGAQKRVDHARAQMAQAAAEARTANADVARYGPLARKFEIAQQQYDRAVATAESANAAVAADQAAVRAAEEEVRQAVEKLRQARAGLAAARATTNTARATAARAKSAEAQMAAAKAALLQAELNVAYTRITAPIDGIVGHRTAQAGENVEPGQELLTIVPTTGLWVTANFKETQLPRMHANERVDISVDGCSHHLEGRVTAIGGATGAKFSLLPPENATGNYVKVVQRVPVRIDFDRTSPASADGQGDGSPDGAGCYIRPGMSVEPSVKVR